MRTTDDVRALSVAPAMRAPRRGAPAALTLLGGALLVVAAGAIIGASGVSVVRHPTDFSIYYAAARALATGRNPYDWHVLRQITPDIPSPGYVYPLWGLLLVLPLAWMPLHVAAGIWLMLNLVWLGLALGLLLRMCGLPLRGYWLIGLFALTCLSIPGLFVLIQGQISLLLLASTVAALWATRAGRGRLAGALIVVALVKPQLTWMPLLVVLAIAWRRGIGRRTLMSAGAVLASLAALSFALRPDWVAGWLAALRADAGAGGGGPHTYGANMGTIPALAAHLPLLLGIALLVACGLVGVQLIVWQGMRVMTYQWRGNGVDQLTWLAIAICIGTALSPWMWIYDGVFWLVPVVVAIARGPSWRRWASMLVYWGVPWAIRLAHVAAAGGGTSLNKLEDVVVAPTLLALALVWTHHGPSHYSGARLPAPVPATDVTPASVSLSPTRPVGQN